MEVITLRRQELTRYQVINETKEMILSLYQNRYYGFNVTHFGEFLKEVHGIQVSRETLRKLLLISGLRTKSKSPPRHRTRRARMPRSGLLVQMDSSLRAQVVRRKHYLAYSHYR